VRDRDDAALPEGRRPREREPQRPACAAEEHREREVAKDRQRARDGARRGDLRDAGGQGGDVVGPRRGDGGVAGPRVGVAGVRRDAAAEGPEPGREEQHSERDAAAHGPMVVARRAPRNVSP